MEGPAGSISCRPFTLKRERMDSKEKDRWPRPFPFVAIVGPTAVGKTEFSLRLAEELGGEIINFDSVQIYKYLDIGSAKPSREERARVKHHLLDLLEPDQPFDAADFVKLASSVALSLIERGKVPILVGGTGFYLRSLEHGLSPLPKAHPPLREWLKGLEREHGPGYLHALLSKVDRESGKRLSPGDTYRLIRALEVFILTGRPMSVLFREMRPQPLIRRDILKICLIRPRHELYARIEQRVEAMVSGGLIEEVKKILDMGYSPRSKPLESLGYRHIIKFLKGEIDLQRAKYEMKRDTRRYAKRQITWFKREPGIIWINATRIEKWRSIWPNLMGSYF